jgi:hypothetical protein
MNIMQDTEAEKLNILSYVGAQEAVERGYTWQIEMGNTSDLVGVF